MAVTAIENNKVCNDKLITLNDCIARIARNRDRTAFAQIFDHYAPQIRAYSLMREPGAELKADELVQEVMIRVWLKASKYNPQLSNLNTWVFTLARNCRIDQTEIFNDIEDDNPGPFQQIQNRRTETNIRKSLKELPRSQAEILTKVYLEGKTHQQASTELQLPLGTVKSRVRLALKKLKVLVSR